LAGSGASLSAAPEPGPCEQPQAAASRTTDKQRALIG
jgi:hypothetical protein